MSLRVTYTNGILEVFDGERPLVYQPFKPTPSGSQDAWKSEADAMAWWDTVKDGYVTTTVTGE